MCRVFLAVVGLAIVPFLSHADAASDIRFQQLQIAARQSQAAGAVMTGSVLGASTMCPTLTRTLSIGSRGSDVIQLKQFLISQNVLATGYTSGYFGTITQAAVQRWQASHGLVSSGTPATTGYGVVGRLTRAAIANVCAGTTNNPKPPPLTCIPEASSPQTQTIACSTGQTGSIVQTRTSSCPYNATTPVWSTWKTTSNTCSNATTCEHAAPPFGCSWEKGATCAQDRLQCNSPSSCTWNNQTVTNGASVTAYQSSSVSTGSYCVSETRSCANGTLSGTYTNASCTVGTPTSCTFNGQTVANGSSVTAYQSSSVSTGSYCVSETRSCTNGTLSGSYTNASCTVGTPTSCTFNGQNISSGSSVTAYQSSSVSTGNQCVSQTRTCTNGTLSGTYTNASCTVETPASCTWNNQTVTNGASVTAYQSSSVAYGSQCISETRVCSNGTLSGSYQSDSCTAQGATSCTFNGQMIANGASVTAYQSPSVAYGSQCVSETRTCTNGMLFGTYASASCSVQAVPAPGASSIPSVADFGAKGDGTTDDTAAFASAIVKGGYVYVPGGKTYLITSALRFEKATMLASDGSATLKMEGAGSIVIHASDSVVTGFSINASSQSASSCVVRLDNNVTGWLQNVTVADLSVTGAPCLVADSALPATFSGDKSIVGLYVDNITSTGARGQQIELKSGFAFIFLRKLSITMAQGLSTPIVRLERNQGAGLTNIKIQGAGGTGDGIRLDTFAAVYISDTEVRGVGGSGIATGQTYSEYGANSGLPLRNVVVASNGKYGIDAQNVVNLLALDVNWAANGLGGGNFAGSSPLVTYTSGTWFPSPPSSFANQPKLLIPNPTTYVSVADYGAKGDGVSDDAAAFEKAVASGKNVFVPPTSAGYRLGRTITLNRPMAMVGVTSKIMSDAGHAFDIVSSSVTMQGLKITMKPSAFSIAVYLNPAQGSLSNVKLIDLQTISAGYSVTNFGSSANEISGLVIAKLRINDFRNIAVHLKNVSNASIDRVFGDIPKVQMSFPFIYLADARDSIISEGTQLGKGPSQPDGAAPNIMIDNGSNVHLRRYFTDGTNSYSVWIKNSQGVYLSENMFSSDLTPIVIENSKLVYALNTVMSENNPASTEAIRITNSDTVGIANLISYNGAFTVTNTGSANVLFQSYYPVQ